MWSMSARQQRSWRVQPPASQKECSKSSRKRRGWSMAVHASTSMTCQRNQAKASMQKKPENATTDQRKGYPGTKAGMLTW